LLPTYAERIIADGASHYWRLDETAGVAVDIIGGAHGEVSGGIMRYQPGAVAGNAAMAFDAGRIRKAGTFLDGLSAFSFELWVRFNEVPVGDQWLGFLDYGCSVGLNNSQLQFWVWTLPPAGFDFFFANAESWSTTPIVPGMFYHLVGVCDGLTSRTYCNGIVGEVVADVVPPGSVLTSPVDTDGFFIGGVSFMEGGTEFKGTIDDVAIYPRALTAAEVVAHYNAVMQPPVVAAAVQRPRVLDAPSGSTTPVAETSAPVTFTTRTYRRGMLGRKPR
jgi:hypothetical protein